MRVVTGRTDMDLVVADTWGSVNRFTGRSCARGTVDCRGGDGSGWYVVPHATPTAGPMDGYAAHCYMNADGRRCYEIMPVDPYWRDGTAPGRCGRR